MPNRPPIGNDLLDALPPAERAAIEATLTLTQLETRKTLYRPHEPIENIYFPVDCVLSVVTAMGNGDSIEICTVGREGLSGSQLTWAVWPRRSRRGISNGILRCNRNSDGSSWPIWSHSSTSWRNQSPAIDSII